MAERIFIPFVGRDPAQDEYRSGRETGRYSAVFIAKWRSRCPRCERMIDIGDDVRMHDDYGGVAVHDHCRDIDCAPREAGYVMRGARQPALCSLCHMTHVGAENPEECL